MTNNSTRNLETRKQIENFFRSLESKHIEYSKAQFCYLATKVGEEFRIMQARLLFNSIPPAAASPHFKSDNILAGVYSLAELKMTPRQLVEKILNVCC
jgi:hypothetical protein